VTHCYSVSYVTLLRAVLSVWYALIAGLFLNTYYSLPSSIYTRHVGVLPYITVKKHSWHTHTLTHSHTLRLFTAWSWWWVQVGMMSPPITDVHHPWWFSWRQSLLETEYLRLQEVSRMKRPVGGLVTGGALCCATRKHTDIVGEFSVESTSLPFEHQSSYFTKHPSS